MFDFTSNLLALAWSLALSMLMKNEVAAPLRKQVVLLGQEMDALALCIGKSMACGDEHLGTYSGHRRTLWGSVEVSLLV